MGCAFSVHMFNTYANKRMLHLGNRSFQIFMTPQKHIVVIHSAQSKLCRVIRHNNCRSTLFHLRCTIFPTIVL